MPGKAVGGRDGAGSVVVLYSDGSWFGTRGNQAWTQASGGVADAPEAGDGFGGALLAREMGGGTPADLAIGVAREDLGATADAGGLLVLYSAGANGLVTGDATWFTKASVDSGTLPGKARLGTVAR